MAINLAPYAIKWTLMFDEVSVVIPGASREEQVLKNASVSELPDITEEQMKKVEEIYNKYIKESVHTNW